MVKLKTTCQILSVFDEDSRHVGYVLQGESFLIIDSYTYSSNGFVYETLHILTASGVTGLINSATKLLLNRSLMILQAIRDNVVISKLTDINKEIELVERIESGDILIVMYTHEVEGDEYYVLTANGKTGWIGLVHADLFKQL